LLSFAGIGHIMNSVQTEKPPVMLITGTRKGIGLFLAQYYTQRGWLVIGCSRGPAEWSDTLYEHHQIDITDEKAVISLFSEIRRRHGRVDAALNNAGIASMNHFILTPGETVNRIFATNVTGTFIIAREAAKLMISGKCGRIVNFSTVAHPLNLEGESVYAASKAAVESLTRTMARELAAWNITVNAIGPTPIDTDLIRGVPPEKMAALLDRLPSRKAGKMEEVAHVIDFFLAPASDCMTGQILYLGGVG
jgi:3-oxoacyl-[acyl-carrier protein] reductase